MARLGTIELFNVSESYDKSVNITEYEVEKGSPFSDHVRQSNPTFSVSGYIFAEDWTVIEQRLEKDMNNGVIMKYVGKFTVNDVVVESFKTSADKSIANGIDLTIRLRRVRITKSSYINAPKKEIPQRKPVTNAGEKKQSGNRTDPTYRFHTVVKGDTYWGLSKRYGVNVDWMIKNNEYPARRIPVGVKLKVGFA